MIVKSTRIETKKETAIRKDGSEKDEFFEEQDRRSSTTVQHKPPSLDTLLGDTKRSDRVDVGKSASWGCSQGGISGRGLSHGHI